MVQVTEHELCRECSAIAEALVAGFVTRWFHELVRMRYTTAYLKPRGRPLTPRPTESGYYLDVNKTGVFLWSDGP